jgi:HSP20 family protein
MKGAVIMNAVETKPVVKNGTEKPVIRREPFTLFDDLQEEFRRFWGQAWPLMPSLFARFPTRFVSEPYDWTPMVDVFEKEGMLVIKAELPGVKKEHIELVLEEGDLISKGERKEEQEVKKGTFYRFERTYGTFYRRIPLPFEAKVEEIKAEYKDGILEVHVPKPVVEAPKARKIALK